MQFLWPCLFSLFTSDEEIGTLFVALIINRAIIFKCLLVGMFPDINFTAAASERCPYLHVTDNHRRTDHCWTMVRVRMDTLLSRCCDCSQDWKPLLHTEIMLTLSTHLGGRWESWSLRKQTEALRKKYQEMLLYSQKGSYKTLHLWYFSYQYSMFLNATLC